MTMDSFPPIIRAAIGLIVAVAVFALALVRRQAGTRLTNLGLWPPATTPDRSKPGATSHGN
jgi:hypothetical protein